MAPSGPFLRLEGITKTYGTARALDGVSLTIARG
jgi:ABC-type sugar transport system ATPase subunit